MQGQLIRLYLDPPFSLDLTMSAPILLALHMKLFDVALSKYAQSGELCPQVLYLPVVLSVRGGGVCLLARGFLLEF